MKLFKSFVLCGTMIVLLFLTGCASIDPFTGMEVPVSKGDIGVSSFKIDQPPVLTTGVPMWRYEEATEFAIPFPRGLEIEYRPYRMSWMVVGIDERGNFYPGVIILDKERKNQEGRFWSFGKVFASRDDVNIFILSTRAKFVYNARGDEIAFDREKFGDLKYGSQLFARGTPLKDLGNPEIFDQIISGWNNRRTSFGFVKTPLKSERFNEIAVINTGYTKNETRVRDRNFRLSPNPIGMTIAWTLDAKGEISDYAGWTDTSGWDMDSPTDEKRKEALVSILEISRNNSRTVEFK